MYVIPKPGLAIRDPHTLVRVPPAGMEVPDGSLEWARILADGDAVIGEPPIEPEPEPEPAAASASLSSGKTKAPAPAAAADEAKA